MQKEARDAAVKREEMVNVRERRERCHIGKLHRKTTRTRNSADASAFVYWIKY